MPPHPHVRHKTQREALNLMVVSPPLSREAGFWSVFIVHFTAQTDSLRECQLDLFGLAAQPAQAMPFLPIFNQLSLGHFKGISKYSTSASLLVFSDTWMKVHLWSYWNHTFLRPLFPLMTTDHHALLFLIISGLKSLIHVWWLYIEYPLQKVT